MGAMVAKSLGEKIDMRYSGFEVTMRGKKAKLGTDFLRKWQDETGRRWVAWSRAWKVTTLAGRWEMWVTGQKDVFKDFKINKRAQIVIVANSWVGATLDLGMCNRFTAKVYNHVGISLYEELQQQYDSTVSDTGQGCLIFYASPTVWPQWNPAHVGIQDGSYIIDINCALGHADVVKKHNQTELADKYPDNVKKSPKELIDLDGE